MNTLRELTVLTLLTVLTVSSASLLAQDAPPDTVPAPPRRDLRLRLAALGEGRYVQHRTDAGFGLEIQSGTVFGAAALIGIGPHVELAGSGATGTLSADTAGSVDATLSRGEAHLAVLPVPWLALRAGGAIHTFTASFASQRWSTLRLGAEGRLGFVGGKLEGLVRFELYPVASATGLPKPNRAFGVASGLRFTSGPVVLAMQYEFERYDFPTVGATARKEQLGTLTIGLGLRR